MERYRLHFETIGYRYVSTASFSPVTGLSSPSHHFLCSQALTVHVVVWFNRTRDTVWTDQVNWLYPSQPEDSCHLDGKYFYNYSRLFDSFNLTKRGAFLVPSPTEKFLQEVPDSQLVECNRTRARQYMDKYGQNYTEEDKVFMRKARQTVSRAKQYLDEMGIPFWLSSGTCLGWFRQCDIIPYSKDVDLGIFIKHFNADLIHAFEQGGFFLKHIFGKVSDSYELSFQSGDIKLDLFFFYEAADHAWNGGTHHETGQKYKYIFPKFSLCWTIFLDLKVRVPCPSQPYIEANYGKNWLEPVHVWEWNRSPPNVRDNGLWPQEEWKEVIQVF
ncbi:ribitol-5-phosphate transferase FKTN-like isoform X2 [Dreissena polymorpha]|nr:ribitol-5-phosphate transferase FKTN-like isoform X2 [Dreissena polymorpha]